MPKKRLNEYVLKNLKRPKTGQLDVWDESLPRFGVRLGTRAVTFILNENKRRVTLGRYPLISLKQARDKAKRRLSLKYFPSQSVPTEEAVEEYLEAKRGEHAYNSQLIYRQYLSKLSQPLDRIDAPFVYKSLPKSKSSAILCFKVYKAFLSWCQERAYITHNPLLGRKPPHKHKTRERLLSDREVAQIWEQSFSHGYFGQLLRLAFLTGQRVGQWKEPPTIHDGLITFAGRVMKSQQDHTIPATPLTLEHLQGFIYPRSFSVNLALIRAALPHIKDWRPHDARRFFSSKCAALGSIDITTTEVILAHTTGSRSPIQRVYDRYNRMKEMRAALEKYQAHLLQLTGSASFT